MQIDSKLIIAGQPALKIRSFLGKVANYSWPIERLQREFQMSLEEARQCLDQLLDLGYVEKDGGLHWKVSDRGQRLRSATAAKPVHKGRSRTISLILASNPVLERTPVHVYFISISPS